MRTLALALILAAGGSSRAEDLRSAMDRAKRQEEQADYAAAARSLESALALHPDDDSVQEELGFVYDELDRTAAAVGLFEQVVRARPADYNLRTRLAQDYARLGRMKEAKAQFARARKIDRKAADAYIMEGYVDLQRRDFAEAHRDFADLIAVDSANPAGYHHMAKYLEERGDAAGAERNLRKALALLRARGPGSAEDVLHATLNLGCVVRLQGRAEEARSIFEGGLARAPNARWQAVFLREAAKTQDLQGHAAQAEALFLDAAKRCEEHPCVDNGDVAADALLRLAVVYSSEGKKVQAEGALDRAWLFFQREGRISAGKFDYQTNLLHWIGQAFVRLGADGKAEKIYRFLYSFHDSMRSESCFPEVEADWADLRFKAGDEVQARRLYRDAIAAARTLGNREEAAALELRLAQALKSYHR